MLEKMLGMMMQSPQMQQTMGQMMEMVKTYDAMMKAQLEISRTILSELRAMRADLEEPLPEINPVLDVEKEIENV